MLNQNRFAETKGWSFCHYQTGQKTCDSGTHNQMHF